MNSPPHILFHRPTIWSSDVQCSTKLLARLFAQKGFDVTYLHNPLDPIHLLRGKNGYFHTWRSLPFNEGQICAASQMTPIPVRDIWPLNTLAVSKMKYRFLWPSLGVLLQKIKRKPPDLVWTTVPGSGAALRTAYPTAKLVFHVIDYYPAFRGKAVQKLEQSDYHHADAIYTIGHMLRDYLVDELKVSGDKITILGQGVELGVYDVASEEPLEILDLPKPRAIWCGVLAKGDPKLFAETARHLRKLGGSLLLIGPTTGWAEKLASNFPETVHLLGSKPSETLPSYLFHSDIGLMLYDRKRHAVYRGQNPLKLYEYAAAGLPIISTPHDEFRYIKPPVREVLNEAEIGTAIDELLSSSDQFREESLTFAENHSWRRKVDEIAGRFLT